jgi:DNA invertase Pin-like site-specific DNA recombinase
MNKRAIALLRVSSNQQDNQRQRSDIERLRKKYSLDLVETVELDGVSGRFVRENARFVQVLEDLRHRPDVAGIALSAIDRFFRTNRYSDTGIFEPLSDAGKLIWSMREGEVDPSTDEGFDTCMTAALKSGAEWRELRRRTMDGKEEKRREKKHPGGAHTIPRGIAYDKATGAWSYREPHCSDVARMYELLLAGESLQGIARRIGGWTYQGVREVLRNPIWGLGTRVYPADRHREEGFEVQVINEPLIPLSTWKAAQEELDRRKDSWRKTKKPPRFLLTGLMTCGECGKRWYVHCGSTINYYRCSSQYRRKPGDSGATCGALSLQHGRADQAVLGMMSQCFTDLGVLTELLNRIARPSAPTRNPDTEIARLEARRERILEQRADGLITREKCNGQIAAIDLELQTARAVVRTQAPAVDPKRLAEGLVYVFGAFEEQPFEFQRDLLREAVREIVVDGRAITRFTFRGRFLGRVLGERVNLTARPNTASTPNATTSFRTRKTNSRSSTPPSCSNSRPKASSNRCSPTKS